MSKQPATAGAVTFPQNQTESNGIERDIPQPRQPENLQGLLRFAMEATKGEDAPKEPQTGPIDQDRKEFLEEALKSMTVDVLQVLQSKINILETADYIKEDSDITEHVLALDTILECIDNMDTANNFHKMGGFTIFNPCLKCERSEIRAGACQVLAELCQNNPYCQKVVVEDGFMPLLLKILNEDTETKVCIKALYAISCIVRHNTEGFHHLIQYQGLTVLLKTLEKGDDKLTIKTTFLLSALCGSELDLKSRLVFMEYIPVLLTLLAQERTPSHEHILSLLLILVEDSHTATNECRNPKHNLKEVLESHLEETAGKEECEEEEMYCKRLMKLLFENVSNGVA